MASVCKVTTHKTFGGIHYYFDIANIFAKLINILWLYEYVFHVHFICDKFLF